MRACEFIQREDLNMHSNMSWRQDMLAKALEPEAFFYAIMPDKTGLDHTIHVSESNEYPCIIIDNRHGPQHAPDINSHVFAFGESTGDESIDKWLHSTAPLIKAYVSGDIDTIELNSDLAHHKVENGFVHEGMLTEMANYAVGRFGNPVAFWIRPEVNALVHGPRVKVNSTYNHTFNTATNMHFVMAFTTPMKIVAGTVGAISSRHVQGMMAWFAKHRTYFIGYYNGTIPEAAFEDYLNKNKYP